MNIEEIENRIIICVTKANGYREVGNLKTADRYDNERFKWEKLLSDLNLLNERKIEELLEYKRGYYTLNSTLEEILEDVAITMDIIKKQPTGNDEWILARLQGILDKGEYYE